MLRLVRRWSTTRIVVVTALVSCAASVAISVLVVAATGTNPFTMPPPARTLVFGLSIGTPLVVSPGITALLVRMLHRVDDLSTRLRQRNDQLQLEIARRRDAERRARRLAVTDDLTQLANRRGFVESADAVPAAGPQALLLLDVDNFKAINDRHGHAAGDLVLCQLARTLESATRHGDVVARVGGEEFAVLTDCPAETATRIAERIRASVASDPHFDAVGGCTVSIGVAAYTRSLEETLGAADGALYEAKARGRDRVVVADAPQPDRSPRSPAEVTGG